MLVVLVASLDIGMPRAGYQIVEYFAGQRRISRLATSIHLRACAHDVLYDEAHGLDESCFNINTNSGFVFGA